MRDLDFALCAEDRAQLEPVECYLTAVAANFFTIANSNLRSLSFRFDE